MPLLSLSAAWFGLAWIAAMSIVMTYVNTKVPEMVMVRPSTFTRYSIVLASSITLANPATSATADSSARNTLQGTLRQAGTAMLDERHDACQAVCRTKFSMYARHSSTAEGTGVHGTTRSQPSLARTSLAPRTGYSCRCLDWCDPCMHC